MERVFLKELNAAHITTRKDILTFLRKLWKCEQVNCPLCGCPLEILHKKAKKIIMIGNVKHAVKYIKRCVY